MLAPDGVQSGGRVLGVADGTSAPPWGVLLQYPPEWMAFGVEAMAHAPAASSPWKRNCPVKSMITTLPTYYG